MIIPIGYERINIGRLLLLLREHDVETVVDVWESTDVPSAVTSGLFPEILRKKTAGEQL